MTDREIRELFAQQGPEPGAEERVWQRLDEELFHEAEQARVPLGGRRGGRAPLRLALALGLVLALLLAIGAAAGAAGFSAGDQQLTWDDEDMHVGSEGVAIPPEDTREDICDDLRERIAALAPGRDLVPYHMPAGARKEELSEDAYGEGTVVNAVYILPDGVPIFLDYQIGGELNMFYPKDPGDPEIYTVGGVEHYIATNNGRYFAVWGVEEIHCAIMGVPSREELVKMLDSIYPEP